MPNKSSALNPSGIKISVGTKFFVIYNLKKAYRACMCKSDICKGHIVVIQKVVYSSITYASIDNTFGSTTGVGSLIAGTTTGNPDVGIVYKALQTEDAEGSESTFYGLLKEIIAAAPAPISDFEQHEKDATIA